MLMDGNNIDSGRYLKQNICLQWVCELHAVGIIKPFEKKNLFDQLSYFVHVNKKKVHHL